MGDFMKVLGVGLITRKLGNKTSPTVTITKEGDEYNFRQDSIKTSEFKFKVGEPFDEVTADGRKVVSTMTQLAPNTMKHEMKGTGAARTPTASGSSSRTSWWPRASARTWRRCGSTTPCPELGLV